jgi:predicted DNA binding CopG/RHH family protein
MKPRTELDALEKKIENSVQNYIPISGTKRRKIETILEVSRKTRNINIRINELDLANLKKNAAEEGMPYQTLISSVLHRYLAGRLIDEKLVRKSMDILSRRERSKAG